MTVCEWWWGPYVISDDPMRLDLKAARHPSSVARRCAANSEKGPIQDSALLLGLYEGDEQLGFVEVETDGATFARLADLVLFAGCDGKDELARWLSEVAGSHPALRGLRLRSSGDLRTPRGHGGPLGARTTRKEDRRSCPAEER